MDSTSMDVEGKGRGVVLCYGLLGPEGHEGAVVDAA